MKTVMTALGALFTVFLIVMMSGAMIGLQSTGQALSDSDVASFWSTSLAIWLIFGLVVAMGSVLALLVAIFRSN